MSQIAARDPDICVVGELAFADLRLGDTPVSRGPVATGAACSTRRRDRQNSTDCGERGPHMRYFASLAWMIGGILPILVGAQALAIGGAPGTYSYDKSPVELKIGNHRFLIPRNYIKYYVPGRTEQETIGIDVILPDLAPIAAENFTCFVRQN